MSVITVAERRVDIANPTAGVVLTAAALALPALAATVALPLATYTISLVGFGLAHVLSEMHYVRGRFAGRLGSGLAERFGLPIAVAVLARAAATWGLLPPIVAVAIELVAAAVLAIGATMAMRRRRAVGTVVGVVLVSGAVMTPYHLLLVLALLHNLTPLGFVAEALEGSARRWMLGLLTIPFIVLPLLIATGLPSSALDAAGLTNPELRVFASGPLALNLGAYIPREFADAGWARHAFSAAVFAQLAHYAAVILLLPRLARGTARGAARRRVAPVAIAACAVLTLVFALDYDLAWRLYSLAALVHAWVEIPILLLALGGLPSAQLVRA
jgi:hypothetical protein